MEFTQGLRQIEQLLQLPLPGESAQHLMAPALRKTTRILLEERKEYRSGGVLMLLYPGANGQLSTLFIERPKYPGVHSGQIAFPGGKSEPGDASLEATALRETEEEVGVQSESVRVIGKLTNLFIPASNFLVHPFIGVTESAPAFRPDPTEVHSLIPETVDGVLNLPVREGGFETSYGLLTAPFYDLKGHAMWGATAMMVSEFREMMKRSWK